jgi:asparagine synthase (glutamine-hydrolysing)
VLQSPVARQIGALDQRGMQQEWARVSSGAVRFDFRVWRWLNLIRWAEFYGVDFSK